MSNKTGLGIAGIALIAFGAFFLLRKPKDVTKVDTPIRKDDTPIRKVEAPIVDVFGVKAKTVKFFDQATTKAGLSAGLSPAQIFALGRTGRINP